MIMLIGRGINAVDGQEEDHVGVIRVAVLPENLIRMGESKQASKQTKMFSDFNIQHLKAKLAGNHDYLLKLQELYPAAEIKDPFTNSPLAGMSECSNHLMLCRILCHKLQCPKNMGRMCIIFEPIIHHIIPHIGTDNVTTSESGTKATIVQHLALCAL
jgi:hypothetical protein